MNMKFKNRPLIGITASQKGGFFLNLCLKFSVYRVGGRPILLRPDSGGLYLNCRGFVVSGGADINPKLYGQENTGSYQVSSKRDAFEIKVIEHALEIKKPLLGICRGMQMINVVEGGTLHQDVSKAYKGFMPTTSLWAKAFFRRVVRFSENSFLAKIYKPKSEDTVNSIHHQAVAKLGDSLEVTAKGELGVVQSIESSDKSKPFILGVQWHPELLFLSAENVRIFKELVLQSKRFK